MTHTIGTTCTESCVLCEADPEAQARKLIDEGWLQVSRKYGGIARLPPGMTGKEALFEAAMKETKGSLRGLPRAEYDRLVEYWTGDNREWVDNMGEAAATAHFCRVHAKGVLRRSLDEDTFKLFRQLGGRTA